MLAHPIFANWTAGELSPLLYGRVDFDKYVSGARRVENLTPHPHGPLSRRAGTRFVAEVKDSDDETYVIPFEFNTEQAYVIEIGPLYMRFYKDGGRIEDPPGTPVEAAHPYTADQLPYLKFIQTADIVYFFHADVSVRKLVRTSHTVWTVKEARFLPPATFEDGFKPPTTLTLGAVTGTGVTFTAGAATFLASDIGRTITIGDGRAVITAQASTTATVDVVDDFDAVGPHASGDWTLEGSPNTQLAVTVAKPRHAQSALTLSAAGWRTGIDEGRYIRANAGVIKITSITSTTAAKGQVQSLLSSTTASPSGSWSLESGSWNATNGHPRCGTLHEQRMVVGGSRQHPQTFWGSASADIENFGLGADDDDAFEFKIAANDVNVLNWFLSTRVLLIGTASAEFKVVGGQDNPITPTNVDVKAETAWGSSDVVRPLRIGHTGIFVDRSRTKVREILYSFDRDSYVANDLLLLAEHLTREHGILELAYQRNPHSVIWAIRDDGVLLSCTYQRDHNVVAWARHFTGPDQPQDGSEPETGNFESVTVIPHWDGDRDVAWFVVRRLIDGAHVRYIEHFDDTTGYYGKLYVDSGLSYDGTPVTTLSGLDHLEGETVAILGDGAVYPDAVVTGGEITLSGPAASVIEVGLPYYSTLETMDPEVPLQGTSQGRIKHWPRIFVRLDQSIGCDVNGEVVPFRASQDFMDAAPPLFTGDVKLAHLGRTTRESVIVQQRQPLPLTVVAVFGNLTIGD